MTDTYFALAFGPKRDHGIVLSSNLSDPHAQAWNDMVMDNKFSILYQGPDKAKARDAVSGLKDLSVFIHDLDEEGLERVFAPPVPQLVYKALFGRDFAPANL